MTLKLFTHDGIFHADEVFATAMFSIISDNDFDVVRGGDEQVPTGSDWIVYDIGGGPLDHHTPENKEANGCHPDTDIPYASCGLVWRSYYEDVLEAMDCPTRYYNQVYRRIEQSLIYGIDAGDNGMNLVGKALEKVSYLSAEQRSEILKQSRNSFTVSQVIKDFNPSWNSGLDQNEAFLDAVAFAKDILMNRIDNIISSLDAKDYVLEKISYSSGHLMIMEEFAPWEGTLYARHEDPKANDIWYVIYPALRGGWNVQCALRDSEDRTSYRHPLPESWYGLRAEDLVQISGIEGALFCHVSGFLAGAKTMEDALEMAQKAMNA